MQKNRLAQLCCLLISERIIVIFCLFLLVRSDNLFTRSRQVEKLASLSSLAFPLARAIYVCDIAHTKMLTTRSLMNIKCTFIIFITIIFTTRTQRWAIKGNVMHVWHEIAGFDPKQKLVSNRKWFLLFSVKAIWYMNMCIKYVLS